MIKYDEFVKLPIFKRGWIVFEYNSIYFFGLKPKWSKKHYCWYERKYSNYRIDTNFYRVDCTGIKPAESLRKVGAK